MDLYRIILVDDEEEVRQSIIRKINWTEAGFQVVGDAENGEDAMEKVEALEPDSDPYGYPYAIYGRTDPGGEGAPEISLHKNRHIFRI